MLEYISIFDFTNEVDRKNETETVNLKVDLNIELGRTVL